MKKTPSRSPLWAFLLASSLLPLGACVDGGAEVDRGDLSCADEDDCLPTEDCDLETALCVPRERAAPVGPAVDLELYRRCANDATLPECQAANAELNMVDSEILDETDKPPAPQ